MSDHGPLRIGTIANYYGGLWLKREDGKDFWTIEDWDGWNWEDCAAEVANTLRALSHPPSNEAKGEAVNECQYAKDVSMPEYRCVNRCQYDQPTTARVDAIRECIAVVEDMGCVGPCQAHYTNIEQALRALLDKEDGE